MQKFEIFLKNNNRNIYRNISLLLVILNVIVFPFFLVEKENSKAALVFVITTFVFVILAVLLKKSKKPFPYSFLFFLLMIIWLKNNNYWIAAINLILSMLYLLAVNKVVYEVNATAVIKRNFPGHKHSWKKFSNVMLKDNMLTLDFTNNRIVQFEIQGSDIFNENEFNEFARKQLDDAAISSP